MNLITVSYIAICIITSVFDEQGDPKNDLVKKYDVPIAKTGNIYCTCSLKHTVEVVR